MPFLPQPSPFNRAWDRHQETQKSASDGWVHLCLTTCNIYFCKLEGHLCFSLLSPFRIALYLHVIFSHLFFASIAVIIVRPYVLYLVFFTDIFIFYYVTYVYLLRLMPLCKTCFDCIFIPLHLTKWAVAHESLCSNKMVNFSAQCSVSLILFEKLTRLSQFYSLKFFDESICNYIIIQIIVML